MPWNPGQATAHTKKAKSPQAKRQWANVADSVLQRTGNDATAIKEANSVIARRTHGLSPRS